MKRLLQALAFLILSPGIACADGAGGPRFMPLAIHLDSPAAVAAWQFELKDRNGAMTVVGVENGGHPAYPARAVLRPGGCRPRRRRKDRGGRLLPGRGEPIAGRPRASRHAAPDA